MSVKGEHDPLKPISFFKVRPLYNKGITDLINKPKKSEINTCSM